MDELTLTSSEVTDLVLTLLDAADRLEAVTSDPADTLASQLATWATWLVRRLDEGGDA